MTNKTRGARQVTKQTGELIRGKSTDATYAKMLLKEALVTSAKCILQTFDRTMLAQLAGIVSRFCTNGIGDFAPSRDGISGDT